MRFLCLGSALKPHLIETKMAAEAIRETIWGGVWRVCRIHCSLEYKSTRSDFPSDW